MKDPEGPFLCLPKIFDIKSDITTQALSDKGWAVTIDEREENYKIRDLERKIFTPARNRLICEKFLEHAQKDPEGKLGRSIVFAVNQTHATTLTKMLNELQPGLAVTITSRIPDASDIAKAFRDRKRPERVAVSVDMLSTGYNCRDLLNIVLARPVFSPTEYIQIKGRGTRRFTFRIGNTEYEKQHFFMLDFCGVAEYFEEQYDYTIPLKEPSLARKASGQGAHITGASQGHGLAGEAVGDEGEQPPRREIPVWTGRDLVVSEEVRIVGPNGEKVDVMTFRGSYERDVKNFYEADREFKGAVEAEDDDVVEDLMEKRFFHNPEMYYSSDKLVKAYGVPAPTPTFVYGALGKKPIPTRTQIIEDTVESLAAQFNLRFSEQKWLAATTGLIADDAEARRRFLDGDMTLFTTSQFNALGGLAALERFTERDQVFNALRNTSLFRQSMLGGLSTP